jgi:hypothetical protein
VPTATFRVLFVFVVLSHERRRVVHFEVTEHPTQEWTMQQMREAFPWDDRKRQLRQATAFRADSNPRILSALFVSRQQEGTWARLQRTSGQRLARKPPDRSSLCLGVVNSEEKTEAH